jgi:hypothetical protein
MHGQKNLDLHHSIFMNKLEATKKISLGLEFIGIPNGEGVFKVIKVSEKIQMFFELNGHGSRGRVGVQIKGHTHKFEGLEQILQGLDVA